IVNKMPFPKGRDPESPMGTRWMGLAVPYSKDERGNKWDGGDDPRSPLGQKFGIHGTNDESTIGIPASGGCIRMYNKDVNELYDLVDIGTPVQIVP
ncbi:MAG: L,D-transpeptidase, partial [Syntrophomonadaceae bacterium]